MNTDYMLENNGASDIYVEEDERNFRKVMPPIINSSQREYL